MYDFPSSPANGQTYNQYTWDGEKWKLSVTGNVMQDYVLKSGDTMSGALSIKKANPGLTLNKTSAAGTYVAGAYNDKNRWTIELGNGSAESTGNVGSDFAINRYNDAGVNQGAPLVIERATGQVVLANNVSIKKNGPFMVLDRQDGSNAVIAGSKSGAYRWAMEFGTAEPENGSNGGSDFVISRYANNGTQINSPFGIRRDTGQVNVIGTLTVQGGTYLSNGGLYVKSGAIELGEPTAAGPAYIDFHTSATSSDYDVRISADGGTGGLGMGRMTVLAQNTTLSGDLVVNANTGIQGALSVNAGATVGALTTSGYVANNYGRVMCSTGLGSAPCYALYSSTGPAYGIWTSNNGIYAIGQTDASAGPYMDILQLTLGAFTCQHANALKPGGGAWGATSDARIKNDLGAYTVGLEAIKALTPKRYTYKGNDTPTEPEALKTMVDNKIIETDLRATAAVPYGNSPHYRAAVAETVFVGLIAQEVETVMPEMVTLREGMIDGVAVTDKRELDTTALIYALVNAVKELSARVEQLEAA